MANGKDPAVLFYTSDFLTGTMTMTNEEVGKYIRLLCLQHQKGRLTEQDMLFICNTYVENVYNKFKKRGDGLYYNERLEQETIKRKAYSESRKRNISKRYEATYVVHMENEYENINENINVINKGESAERGGHINSNSKPTLNEVIEYFESCGYPKEQAESFWSTYESQGWETKSGAIIRNWQAKVIGWMNNSKQFDNKNKEKKKYKYQEGSSDGFKVIS